MLINDYSCCLSVSKSENLIHVFISSRLDYCNALLCGFTAHFINKIQLFQNKAAIELVYSFPTTDGIFYHL